MDVHSTDRTARWVQTHAIRPHPQRHQSSPTHSRSASSRHNQGVVSGASFVSQHSSQTELDTSERPAVYVPSPMKHSKHQYPSHADAPEVVHVRSKHSYGNGSRHRDDYDSRRSREKSYDERGSTTRQRHIPPRINIPDELYRSPNLPAFVQGPPGSGYPMTMTPIRSQLPSSPTGFNAERAAVQGYGPPSPPLVIPAQLNPKKSRPTSDKRRPSLSGATFEPPFGLVDEHDRDRERRSSGHSGEGRRLRKRAASDVRR